MKRTALIISVLALIITSTEAFAAKLVELKVVDKDYIMAYFKDGDINFVDDGLGTDAFTGNHQTANNYRTLYGSALNTTNAVAAANWVITSAGDSNYGTTGLNPLNCYRKSRMNGMAEMDWNSTTNDWTYLYTMEHWIFLRLPSSLTQGASYTIEINANTNSDVLSQAMTFDIFSSKSEAIHTNLVGYLDDSSVKAVDLFIYMGDGGARDYSSFVGKKAYIYNVNTSVAQEVNTVSFWKTSATEMIHWNLTGSNVWKADFTGFNTPGTYRVAIEGVGCSEDFEIKKDVYFEPFRVSTIGFFYMRIGQDSNYTGMPVPRKPLYIPPSGATVYITTMSPIHPEWGTFSGGDVWDNPSAWAPYRKPGNPVNNNAYGGHSDAADWDRHLGHISNIYDMLLPYILTDGKLPEDNLQIAESGNGIPDILDEARNEVDFWLRLKDGDGYSHGLTNPTGTTLYQAGTTPMAAWANAANASMLANCFMLAGLDSLSDTYRDAAITAYNYASGLPDQMLTATQGVGDGTVRGKDLKMMAAAYLYNVTGNTAYEDMLNSLCDITSDTSVVADGGRNQLWACAAYLKSQRTVHYPTLFSRMKNSVINEAKNMEANYSSVRPTRRASDNTTGWFKTDQNVQRCIVAHAVATNPSDIALFENAMVLEADWGLGRNNMNTIIMTTACTNLANKRSIRNAYTTGRDDGSPGVHPGYTPYLNTEDWASSGMVGNRPSVLAAMCYPAYSGWPAAEGYFDTRYVWAHTECTPQQSMRGKQALYGYLYGLYNQDTDPPSAPAGLSATPGNQVVSLNWNDNSEGDVNGYNVYRSTVSGGPYTKQNGSLLSSSNYTDTNVTNGTTYYYVVTAVDTSANESDNSTEVSAVPYADTTPPAVPTGLSATPGQGTVSLNWNDNGEGDLAGYNIYRSTVSGGPYTKQNGPLLSSSDYIDNNVTNGTTYYYVVTAVDTSTNESNYSSQVSATPVDLPPAAPTGLAAVAGNGTVSLNWNNNGEGDLAGYNVYRSTTHGSGYSKLNGSLLSTSDYTDNSVTNGTTYYYVVTAVDMGTNESVYSSEVSATPNANVAILGSWAAGTSHTKENGNNRALIFIAHVEHSAAITLNSVTYGGQTMTKVIDTVIGTGTRAYVAAFILNEAGVAAATNSTFMPSWSATPSAVAYSSVFLTNVNEANLIGPTAFYGIESSTPNPVTTTALATNNGDMVFVAATCGNAGNYTLNNGFTEGTGTDQQMNSTATGVAGYKSATGAAETPSATYNTGPNRQVIIGFVVRAPAADLPPAAPTGLSATAGFQTVSLDWSNNGEGDLAGYNVYRSTTQGSGYSKLNGSLLTSSDYIDNTVTNGTTYYYVVTAVDTNSNESTQSTEVSATPHDYLTCADVQTAGYSLPADLDGDCYIDYWDLEIIAYHWLRTDCVSPDNCEGADLPPTNGAVDFIDFGIFAPLWLQCNDPENPECTPNWP